MPIAHFQWKFVFSSMIKQKIWVFLSEWLQLSYKTYQTAILLLRTWVEHFSTNCRSNCRSSFCHHSSFVDFCDDFVSNITSHGIIIFFMVFYICVKFIIPALEKPYFREIHIETKNTPHQSWSTELINSWRPEIRLYFILRLVGFDNVMKWKQTCFVLIHFQQTLIDFSHIFAKCGTQVKIYFLYNTRYFL